MPNLETVHDRI